MFCYILKIIQDITYNMKFSGKWEEYIGRILVAI